MRHCQVVDGLVNWLQSGRDVEFVGDDSDPALAVPSGIHQCELDEGSHVFLQFFFLVEFDGEGAGGIDDAESHIAGLPESVGGAETEDGESVGSSAGEVDVVVAGLGEGVED